MITINDYLAGGQTTISNLLLENYHRLGLSVEEFMLWLQLFKEASQGNSFPELPAIAKKMGIPDAQVYHLLDRLVKLQFLEIKSERNAQGQQSDRYDLNLAFEKLSLLKQQQEIVATEKKEQDEVRDLYKTFEKELNRPLSSMEIENVGQWLDEDHYSPELIKLALREAVLNQVYNFKYMDKVLLSWERKNVHTKEQVQQELKRRRSTMLQKDTQIQPEDLPKISFHNWLDGGDA
jgi:DNA replication protein